MLEVLISCLKVLTSCLTVLIGSPISKLVSQRFSLIKFLFISNLFLIFIDRIAVISPKDEALILSKIQSDPFFKGTYKRSLLKTLYTNQISSKSSRFVMCKEVFMTIPIVIYTSKDFYLLDSLSDKIELLKSTGLITKWHYDIIKKDFMKFDGSSQPKVLTLDNLLGCFKLLGLGCLASVLVFAGELLFNKLKPK